MRTRNIILVVAVVAVLAVVLLGVFPMMGYGAYGGFGYGRGFLGPGMMGGYWFIWPFFMMLFWIVLIPGAIILIARGFAGGSRPVGPGRQGTGDRALEILRERYARGEITKEQFDQMRGDLGVDTHAGPA